MLLTFDRTLVQRLVDHAEAAPSHRATYAQPDGDPGPGLWLVADNGIYLMSNGTPGLRGLSGEANLVVYARECDPTAMEFDDWWEAKQAAAGGDDSVEFIPLSDVIVSLRLEGDFQLDCDADAIVLHMPVNLHRSGGTA